MFWLFLLGLLTYFSYKFLYATPGSAEKTSTNSSMTSPTISPVEVPETTTLSARDQIVGVVESLNWCNDITRICWPHIGKIMELQLIPTIEPLVNLYLPKPFSKFQFLSAHLGKVPLTVDRVTVHRRFHNSISLDLDVSFKGSPTMSMRCAPLRAAFGIKELRWTGRLSVLMRPLIPRIPLVGAVQVAMVTHPDIFMDFTGIANLADFGPIEKIVRMVLKNVIASMLVLPNRFMYKLSDSVDFFDAYCSPVGVICVTIDKGRGFTKEKKVGLIKSVPDLYCKATFGLEEMKTDVQTNNLNPIWEHTHPFILSDTEQPFELGCYDKDALSRDDLVGNITFTAKELLRKETSWEKLQENVCAKVAKDAEILLRTDLYVFQHPTHTIRGRCVVSILIDRAKNLPPSTKAVACKVKVGSHTERETPQIVKPEEYIPGIDPVNPIWSFSFDILCDEVSQAEVLLEVVEGKRSLGRVLISGYELDSSLNNTKSDDFPIGKGATLRAKIMLQGLVQDNPTEIS